VAAGNMFNVHEELVAEKGEGRKGHRLHRTDKANIERPTPNFQH
jgi:hypothetical protein